MATSPQKQSSLRDVINKVTKEKLTWLENQRKSLQAHYAPILEKYSNPENASSLKFLKEIYETLKACPDGDNPAPNTTEDLSVFLNWIDTEDEDNLIYFGTKQLVKDWNDKLISHIRNQIEKCEYSCLYANAMTQYMDYSHPELPEVDGEVPANLVNETLANNKAVAMEQFVTRSFGDAAPQTFSKDKFEKLLNTELFDMDNPVEEKQLKEIRYKTKQFCKTFADSNPITPDDLKYCIGSLTQGVLLSKDKNVTLKELQKNSDALEEVCTLLNKQLKNFSGWKWPEPVVVRFKRYIDGRYRAYMNEDILTALFLHYVGAKWNIYFKSVFKSIYTSKIWKRGTGEVSDLYYQSNSIEGFRRDFHAKLMLTVLPNNMQDLDSSTAIYDENEGHNGRSAELTPMQLKQQMLHLISNEIHLNSALRPEKPITIVQTDMEWFGPSLVHEAVISLMDFFGVSAEWLGFFKTFLEAPLKIAVYENPTQVRKRGAPISHQLKNLFGESLLFSMELFVNKQSGLSLYRIHDDFWFWGHQNENVLKAWKAMETFTEVAGLALNLNKSGSIICNSGGTSAITPGREPLPQGGINWGFIVLHSDGIFRISDDLLAPHLKAMREYLDGAESLVHWIHSHNRYLRFFIRNFGQSAQTFGKQHLVQIMTKLKEILRQVHPETNGDVVEKLKLKYPDILKGNDVMDSWVRWSVEDGGLSLYNPFLELVPLHEAYRRQEQRGRNLGEAEGHFGERKNADRTEWDRLLAVACPEGSTG